MLDKLTNQLDFHAKGLLLRSERQRVIASNIANADTPGYAARDFNFSDAMKAVNAGNGGNTATGSLRLAAPGAAASSGGNRGFIPLGGSGSTMGNFAMGYVTQTQTAMDGNSVDLDRERAAFADNAVRYEATLRFINGSAKTMLTAIQGQ